MKRILITIVGFICCILNAVSAEKLVSHFQDTSAQCALQKNIVADYGAKPDSHEDQSAIWQNAIEELSASGGGRIRPLRIALFAVTVGDIMLTTRFSILAMPVLSVSLC